MGAGLLPDRRARCNQKRIWKDLGFAARLGCQFSCATRAIARQRRFAQNRLVITAAVYGALIAPFAAGALSAGFIAAAIVQAIVVLPYAHPGIFRGCQLPTGVNALRSSSARASP